MKIKISRATLLVTGKNCFKYVALEHTCFLLIKFCQRIFLAYAREILASIPEQYQLAPDKLQSARDFWKESGRK